MHFAIREILFWILCILGASALAFFLYLLVEKWEIIMLRLKKWATRLIWSIICLLVLGFLLWQYLVWMGLSHTLKTEERVKAETEIVRTVAQVIGGGILLYGVYLTLRRIRALEIQVEISRDEQVTDRFTKAIEQLGSEKMEVRLGAIYALERISKDSPKDYWTIMEILTSFVRENAPWPPKTTEELWEEGEERPIPKPRTDIQAVLNVLSRRAGRFGQSEVHRLDLRRTDLRGSDLIGAHLEGARLRGTHLEDAFLLRAHLDRALLWRAHMEMALLGGAQMKKAVLRNSYLQGADLVGAHLEEAELHGADLDEADLQGAHLEGAVLWSTYMRGTTLVGTNLEGADLRGAEGLTWQQLSNAIVGESTKLPDYLTQTETAKTETSES